KLEGSDGWPWTWWSGPAASPAAQKFFRKDFFHPVGVFLEFFLVQGEGCPPAPKSWAASAQEKRARIAILAKDAIARTHRAPRYPAEANVSAGGYYTASIALRASVMTAAKS